MTSAIILTSLAAIFWGITNHIDKYLLVGIDENGSNLKVLLIFSTFIAGLILTPFWFLLSPTININTISLISVFTASVIYILGTVFFFKAMEENDASVVVILSELIPVFDYILALILFKEHLTFHQIIGSIIIIIAAIIISFDFNEKNNRKMYKALLLMTISSLLYAIYFIFFDIAIRNSSYYSCAFWYQIGLLIIGLVLLCIRTFRQPFLNAIKKNGKKYFTLNATNEVLNLLANLLINLANLAAPIALVTVIENGLQGMFVFIIGILGTMIFPKYIKEDLSKRVVIQKVLCIILGIIGLIILAC